jgi:hypothetical protein
LTVVAAVRRPRHEGQNERDRQQNATRCRRYRHVALVEAPQAVAAQPHLALDDRQANIGPSREQAIAMSAFWSPPPTRRYS